MEKLKIQALTYLSGAWPYRRWGLLLAWLVCAIGWGGVLVLPNRYQSEAQVYINTDTYLPALLKGLAVNVSPKGQIDVMLKSLAATPNIEQIIRLTDPNAVKMSKRAMQDRVGAIQREISMRPLGAKNLFGISYTSTNPKYSQAVAQALVTILVNSNLGDQRQDVEGVQTFIQQKVKEYEAQLRAAEKRRADFRAAHLGLLLDKPGEDRLDKAQTDVVTAQHELDAAIARRDSLQLQLRRMKPVLNVDVPGNGNADTTTTDLSRAKQQLQSLQLKYTDSYPDVIAMKQTIAKLEAEGGGVSGAGPHQGISNPAFVAIQTKLSDEETNVALQQHLLKEAQANVENTRKMLAQALTLQRQYADLDRDYQVIHDNYEQLLQRREAARLSQSANDAQSAVKFRIVDPPRVPDRPSSPNRLLLNFAVLAISLGLGTALAILLGLNAARFSVSDQLASAFSLPVLGVISVVLQPADIQRQRRAMFRLVGAVGLLFVAYAVLTLFFHTAVTGSGLSI